MLARFRTRFALKVTAPSAMLFQNVFTDLILSLRRVVVHNLGGRAPWIRAAKIKAVPLAVEHR